MTPKLRSLLLVLLVIVPIDQISKTWVASTLAVGSASSRIPVIDGFFYITHVRNPGAAFGLLADWPEGWRLVVFFAVASIAVFVVCSFFRGLAPRDHANAVALGLILGGAIGNLIDRAVHGEVIDFLHFRLWTDSWPDFNLADVFIIAGVTALMLELLASEGAARSSERQESGEASVDGDDDG